MFSRRSLLSLVFAAASVAAFSSVNAAANGLQGPGSRLEFQQQVQQIRDFAQANGLIISNLKVSQSVSMGADEYGQVTTASAAGGSCTVSAAVSIPGGTGVTISATAPTCAAAARMVMGGVRAVKGMI
jgi:hypothetical protein